MTISNENLRTRFNEMGRIGLEFFIEDLSRAYELLERHKIDSARSEISILLGEAKKEKIKRDRARKAKEEAID